MKGKQPYWPGNLMKRYIRPPAKKFGIHKNIGWHTFRHSFGTLLKANGGKCEDGTGALKTRQQQDHTRRLHAGRELDETSRTEQGCKDDGSQRGHSNYKSRH